MYNAALRHVAERTARNVELFRDQFPHIGENSSYRLFPNTTWTNGFWTGLLWLCHKYTGDRLFAEQAQRLLPSFEERLAAGTNIDHDVGFLFILSAKAQWLEQGDEGARALALRAADALADRWRPEGGYIQAWGDKQDAVNGGRIIMDCLLNLPLLYWAAEETGDTRYSAIAEKHAEKSRRFLIRGDDSSYHTFLFDPATGYPIGGTTHQGLHNGSTWSRGQSWGVYGFALSYRYTKQAPFLDTAIRMANHFIGQLPEDGVAYWDFSADHGSEVPRDSSATAICLCGLLEIMEHLDEQSEDYRLLSDAAARMMGALVRISTMHEPEAQGLLKHGAYHVGANNVPDGYLIFGDYYYAEALMRFGRMSGSYW
ncbi:glycoside hydrolase family 88 protein [Paenibacillus chungangensis]|uniref:Glycoside hydrolase family 88 protein n=1 Tax=Paenibacillus chungangensis TaxID=696535 RepID=A0ABW3HKZ5_9BACL